MVCQGPFVQSHQLTLTRGSRRLQGHHGLGPLGKLKPLATETDSTTGNQHNAIAPCKGSSDACSETIDRCGGIPPQQTRAQLHHPQRHAVGAPIQAARRRSNRWTRSWRQGCPVWEMGRTSTV